MCQDQNLWNAHFCLKFFHGFISDSFFESLKKKKKVENYTLINQTNVIKLIFLC